MPIILPIAALLITLCIYIVWKKIVEKAKTLHELQRLLRRRYT